MGEKLPKHTWRRRILKLFIWIVILIALWGIVMGLIVPPILRSVAEKQLSKNLGSACTLGKVTFNPYTFNLTLDKLRIPLPDGKEFFSLEQFNVRLSPETISRFAPVISQISFVRPVIDVELRPNGQLSFMDLTAKMKENEAKAQEGKKPQNEEKAEAKDQKKDENNLFGIVVNYFLLSNGEVKFHDGIRKTDHTITDINFSVPFTSTLQRHRQELTKVFLKAIVNDRPFNLEGKLTPFADDARTEFNIDLDRFDLTRLQPYLVPFTTAKLSKGTFSSKLVLSMLRDLKTGMRIGLEGTSSLDGLEIQGPDGKEALQLPKLAVDLTGSVNTQEGLTINTFEIQGLKAWLTLLENGAINWQTWLKPQPADKPAAQTDKKKDAQDAQSEPALPIHLKHFAFKDGQIAFTDQKIVKNFNFQVDGLNFTLDDLEFPFNKAASKINCGLTFNKKTQLAVDGGVAMDPLDGKLTVKIEGVPLPDFQPYLNAFKVPLTLEKGTFGFKGQLEVGQPQKELVILLKNGETSLKTLSVVRNDTKQAFFKLGELALTGIEVNVPKQQASVKQLLIDQPDIQLKRLKNGEIDLPQFGPQGQAASGAQTAANAKKPAAASQKPASDSKPWQARVPDIRLNRGRIAVTLDGDKENSVFILQNLTGQVSNFDTATPKTPLDIKLSGQNERGGSLNVNGKLVPDPLDMNMRVQTDKFNLQPFSPILSNDVSQALRLRSGSLSMALQTLLKTTKEGPAVTVKGQTSLENLSLIGNKQEFMSLRAMNLQDMDLDTARQRYTINRVFLQKPRVNVTLDAKGNTNLAALMPPDNAKAKVETKPSGKSGGKKAAAPAPAAKSAASGPQPYLKINLLEIADGSAQVKDNGYQPAMIQQLDKLKLTLRGLETNPNSIAKLAFSGEFNNAPLTGEGTIQPFAKDLTGSIKTSLKSLKMPMFSPMSSRYIAYPLSKGTFALESDIKINQGKLDSTHQIKLDGLELGKKVPSPDAPNLPIELGLKLLKDVSGNIHLNLPVNGDLNDPSFSIGGIVLKTLSNLLIKVVASPFKMIGGMIGLGGSGGDDEGSDRVIFAPGDNRLIANNIHHLPDVVKLMKARSQINLVLEPQADEEDRQNLADAYVGRRMRQLKYESLSKKERAGVDPETLDVSVEHDAEEYEELLFKVYAEQSFDKAKGVFGRVKHLPAEEMLEQIRTHFVKDDSALRQLARERAQVLKDALVKLSPDLEKRISIGTPKVPGEGHQVIFGVK